METSVIGLFLLPAVVGYLLLMQLRHTRHKTIRQSGYHLFFKSILAGSLLVAVVAALFYLIVDPSVFFAYGDILILLAASLGLALLLPLVWDRLPRSKRRETDSILKSARARGDIIEALLETAALGFMPVQLKLIGGNMHVGFVAHSGITSEEADTDVSLFLICSGHQDKETRKLVITEDYSEKISGIWRGGEGNEKQAYKRREKPRRHTSVMSADYLRGGEEGGDEMQEIAIPIHRIESARILSFDQLFDIVGRSFSPDDPREDVIDNAA